MRNEDRDVATVGRPTAVGDIELIEFHGVQHSYLELPREFNIRPNEFGVADGVDQIAKGAVMGDEDSIRKVKECKTKYLNLMRLKCKLPPTSAPVKSWPQEDLMASPLGNDYVASAKGTRSPGPGYAFRYVDNAENWECIFKRLIFWEPEIEGGPKPERIAILERSPMRKKALSVIGYTKEKVKSS